jgi:hypothetical protein
MTELEKLKQQLNQLQEKINNLEKQDKKRKWQPQKGEEYYFINDIGNIERRKYDRILMKDIWLTSQGNYFRTQKEAATYLFNLRTKAELRALAEGLNGDRVINWNDTRQDKHSIIYNGKTGTIDNNVFSFLRAPSLIYCLDENFGDKAIEQIGEQRLIDMIRSGV